MVQKSVISCFFLETFFSTAPMDWRHLTEKSTYSSGIIQDNSVMAQEITKPTTLDLAQNSQRHFHQYGTVPLSSDLVVHEFPKLILAVETAGRFLTDDFSIL